MLANGFLISCANIAETSASAIALRAASRSRSASLLAVTSRSIQMLCSPRLPAPAIDRSDPPDSLRLLIASHRFVSPRARHTSYSTCSSTPATSISKSTGLTAATSRSVLTSRRQAATTRGPRD